MSEFCSDLQSGHPADGYSLTSSSFRARTTQHAFTAEVLPQGVAATRCSFSLQAAQGNGTDDATMTVTQRGSPRFWLVALVRSAGPEWQVHGIAARSG